jgi:DNA repair protein RecO (recombination protein O)
MSRTFTCRGLVLRVRPSGESNREVTFLTAEEGILRATVFGGPKSRLRAHAAPYHEGTVWFYRDPAKDFYKVTDFDVELWRPGLRESYGRSMTAASVAETLLASHGGGGAWAEALNLAGATLDALETADDRAGRRIAIRFFWNWAEVLGSRPGLDNCASCGRSLAGGETAWYARREEQLFCASCAGFGLEAPPVMDPGMAAAFLPVSAGTRRWLIAVESLHPAQLGRYTLDRNLENEAKSLATAILSAALGKRLATWDW